MRVARRIIKARAGAKLGGSAVTFTEDVKGELVRIIDSEPCCRRRELAAIIRHGGILQLSRAGGMGLNIHTQNPAVARLVLQLLKERQPEARVFIRRRSAFRKNRMYLLFAPKADKLLLEVGLWDGEASSFFTHLDTPESECCNRAYLRGAFIISGSMSDPQKASYHLEMVCEYQETADYLRQVLEDCGLSPRLTRRKELLVVYLKEGEQVVDFLNLIGAHASLLKVEDARVRKSMRNQVNRLVNAETANLNKTISTAWRHIECIRYVDQVLGTNNLSPNLRLTAELRAKHPEASLQELGLYFSPPLSKGAVNHRLRKIEELAKELGYGGVAPG